MPKFKNQYTEAVKLPGVRNKTLRKFKWSYLKYTWYVLIVLDCFSISFKNRYSHRTSQ